MPVVGRLDQYASMLAYEFDDYSMSENLLTYSEQFDNASWLKNNYNVTANVTTAPDGTLTADKLIAVNASTYHDLYKAPSLGSNTYTLSIFAKAAEQSFIQVRIDDGTLTRVAMFNLSTGSVSSSSNVTSSTITSYLNGWYRCSITVTTNIINVVFNSFPTSSNATYSGDGVSGIYIWGAQFEYGSVATDYTSTTTTAISRVLASTTNTNIASTGTYYSSGFDENVGFTTLLSANVFAPYDPVYDQFGGTLFGAGQGRYMRQNIDKSVIVYNEIDELSLGLYPFDSFTFTYGTWARSPNGNSATPRQTTQSSASTGDTLATFKSIYNTATYSWINDTAYYNVTTAGFQKWTAPADGIYRIIVAGAAGGSHQAPRSGGSGAIITADVSLTKGQIYTILVGKTGENTVNLSTTNAGAGGGGGSFFFINATDTTPIIAAGGGGGSARDRAGVNASLTTSGADGNGGLISGGAIGGVNGGISTVNSADGNYDAGGGAGWLAGNGEINSNANDASFGYAPRNGGGGGFRSADGTDDWGGHGGFGGGGGGTTESGSAGGGGGYSGGGKGSNNTTYGGGGGGGSFYTGTLVSSSASNTGQGYVTITKL